MVPHLLILDLSFLYLCFYRATSEFPVVPFYGIEFPCIYFLISVRK